MKNKTLLTKEKLEEYLVEIFETPRKKVRNITIGQGCLEQGFVTRTSLDLKICNNFRCNSCSMLHKLISKEADEFLKLDLEE